MECKSSVDAATKISIDDSLNKLATSIVQLRLDSFAVFLIEAHLPLNTIFHNLTFCAQPFATAFGGTERFRVFQSVLADRKNVEQLMNLIETKRAEQNSKGRLA